MTGVIVCDRCGDLFLSHGSMKNIPKILGDIPEFDGVRVIKTKNLFGELIPEFKDYCGNCSVEVKLKK